MDGETGAFSEAAGHFDSAALAFNDGFANREAESVAALGTGAGFVRPIKPFENVG
jgi:hypothetical protein